MELYFGDADAETISAATDTPSGPSAASGAASAASAATLIQLLFLDAQTRLPADSRASEQLVTSFPINPTSRLHGAVRSLANHLVDAAPSRTRS